MTLIVGLTGGIGSGKTAASTWFEQQGITVVDADIVAREVVQIGQPALQEIKASFGDWVLHSDGSLNRQALRKYIFENIEAKQTLEQITHPRIRTFIIQQLECTTSQYAILVSPLLFETDQHLLTQRTLLIDTSIELQKERAMKRDLQSQEQIEKIIKTQMPRSQKLALADNIVINSSTLNDLYQQLFKLHQQYLEYAKKSGSI